MTAVRLMPKFAAAHSNLGSVLKEQGKLVSYGIHMKAANRMGRFLLLGWLVYRKRRLDVFYAAMMVEKDQL